MSKGLTPSLSPGDLSHLKEALDRIDAGENPIVFLQWIAQQRQQRGDQGYTDWLSDRWNDDLDLDLRRRFMYAMCRVMPPEFSKMVNRKSLELLAQEFIKAGLQPGLDFSLNEDEMILSDQAEETMYRVIPEEGRKGIEKQIRTRRSCPWEKVEERLGVPFRENLMLRLDALVEAQYPPGEIAGWMVCLSPPIAYQVLGDFYRQDVFSLLYERLQDRYPELFAQVQEMIHQNTGIWTVDQLQEAKMQPMIDVAIAAGSSIENGEISEDGQAMSRAALEKLALVWRGNRQSIPELIAEFDQWVGRAGTFEQKVAVSLEILSI